MNIAIKLYKTFGALGTTGDKKAQNTNLDVLRLQTACFLVFKEIQHDIMFVIVLNSCRFSFHDRNAHPTYINVDTILQQFEHANLLVVHIIIVT